MDKPLREYSDVEGHVVLAHNHGIEVQYNTIM